MTKLQELLKELGLEQYTDVFADNGIDFDILLDLAESDFEKLGILFGHRRKLLKALAALKPTPTQSEGAPTKAETQEAERRQVTVFFSDLVGSTALANKIDPEEMSELIRRYQGACARAIGRFDGYIAKFLGDGVLAYFGYPQGQEDAAERSVYAALALIESVSQLKRPDGVGLEARIGIATGLVVIGDIIGSGAAREHSIVGETPNLAARLQALAEPNSIVVSQSTHRLLGRQFDYQNLGKQNLKGFDEPVQVWRVLREAAVASRFAAGRAPTDSPFIGRVQEINSMLDRWAVARKGKGHAIFLSAEAGMGKSRMVDALRERIVGDSYYDVTCQCSPYYTNSPLHPIIRQLERVAGFVREDSAKTKLEKLESLLSATDNLSESTRALFADLLSVPQNGQSPSPEIPPAQRKAATIAAIVQQLRKLAAQKPVLFVLEDVHWIDPTTQELITRLIDSINAISCFAIITARPEFVSPWTGRDHVTSLALSRLSKNQCAEFIAGVAAERMLQPELVADIVGKSDGVPLFLEELTKTVVESAGSDQPAVPATLHDSLMARLDRTGPAKEIAQIAAVIGQQFSYALLETVGRGATMDVESGIARLVEAGLVLAQTRSTEPGYAFKHALIRDVAYDNLLRTRRQQIHERVARTLETEFPSVVENEPELLAQHFSRARVTDAACNYFERAGDRASGHSNFAEAVAHFGAGLQQTAHLVEDTDRSHRELALLLKLGPALAIMKGPQSPEVEDAYKRARAVAELLGDDAGTFKATWGLWLSANVSRKLDQARDRAQQLVALGQRSADSDLLLEALHCRWSTAQFRGDAMTSVRDSEEGIKRYDPARHSWMGPVFGGHDPGVCAYACNGNNLCLSGILERGKSRFEKALALAESLKHPHTLVFAFQNGTIMHQVAGDYATVERLAQSTLELADRYNFPPQRAHALLLLGWAQSIGQNSDAGLKVMEAEYPRAAALGPLFRYYAALLAEVRAKFGNFSDALTLLRSALETVTEPGIGLCVPELYRLQGLCLLHLGSQNKDEAMSSLRTAVDTAKQQSAALFQLKSAIDLARADSRTANLQLLRDTCANLPEGFDAPQLLEARQLLAGAN